MPHVLFHNLIQGDFESKGSDKQNAENILRMFRRINVWNKELKSLIQLFKHYGIVHSGILYKLNEERVFADSVEQLNFTDDKYAAVFDACCLNKVGFALAQTGESGDAASGRTYLGLESAQLSLSELLESALKNLRKAQQRNRSPLDV